jgi:hypothetical protein
MRIADLFWHNLIVAAAAATVVVVVAMAGVVVNCSNICWFYENSGCLKTG